MAFLNAPPLNINAFAAARDSFKTRTLLMLLRLLAFHMSTLAFPFMINHFYLPFSERQHTHPYIKVGKATNTVQGGVQMPV